MRRLLAGLVVTAALALVPSVASAATYNEALLYGTFWTVGTAQAQFPAPGAVVTAPLYVQPYLQPKPLVGVYFVHVAWSGRYTSPGNVVRCDTWLTIFSTDQVWVYEQPYKRRCV